MGEKLRFKILGIFDASHAYAVERVLKHKEGIKGATLSSTLEELSINYDLNITSKDEIKALIEHLGYKVKDAVEEEPASIELARHKELHSIFIHFISAVIMTTPVVVWSYFQGLFPYFGTDLLSISVLGFRIVTRWVDLAIFLLTTIIIFVSGHILYKGAFRAIRHKITNMDGLISVGIFSIYFYSIAALIFAFERHYFDTAALLVSFLLFGRLLEAKIRWQETGLTRSFSLPKTVRLHHKTKHETKNTKDLESGDVVIVDPEEIIPVDGRIIEGYSIVDESAITGENVPREKKTGDMVFAGSKNTTGLILVQAERIGEKTTLANITRLVSEAHREKSQIQLLADRTARFYVPLIVLIGIITFIGWYLNNVDFVLALTALASVFVIGTPSTLALATPTAILVGMNIGLKNGILFRTGIDIEKLSKVNTVILSKEGVITERFFHLNEVVKMGKSRQDPLKLAMKYLTHADNEISKSLKEYADMHKLKFKADTSKKNMVDAFPNGIKSKSQKQQILIGDKNFLLDNGISISTIEANILHYEMQGKTVWIIAKAEEIIGLLVMTSPLKDYTLMSALELKKNNYETFLSSWESLQTTQAIGTEVGIEKVLAGMNQEKLTKEIARLQEEGRTVAYITDDNEETEPLSQADVGITMGDYANISASASDVFLFKDDPREFIVALELARATFHKVRMNIFWSLAYNVAAVPLAAGVLYPFLGVMMKPEVAASMMVLSSISILLNSVGLKKYVPEIKKFDVASFRR